MSWEANILTDGTIEKVHKVCVHTIRVSDVEDPDLFAAEPLDEWIKSEKGRWIMKHSRKQPIWDKNTTIADYYHTYYIIAWLEEKDLTYWKLKYE